MNTDNINVLIQQALLNTHVALPCEVLAVDTDKYTVDVKILATKPSIDGRRKTLLPLLYQVSIQTLKASNSEIYLPITAGDMGTLLIEDYDYEKIVTYNGYDYAQEHIDNHTVNNATYMPITVVASSKYKVQSAEVNDIIVKNDKLKINIKAQGKLTVTNDNYELLKSIKATLEKLRDAKTAPTTLTGTVVGTSPAGPCTGTCTVPLPPLSLSPADVSVINSAISEINTFIG